MFESTVVSGKVFTDESGIYYELPVILTREGQVNVLLDYLLAHWDVRSTEWRRKVTATVRLFLYYLAAHRHYPDERAVFQNFRQRMLTGTVSAATGEDPSDLWWSASPPKKVNLATRHLTDMFKWWTQANPGKTNPAMTWRGSAHDLRLAEAAYTYRRNEAFLGHTWSTFEETSHLPRSGASTAAWHRPPRTEKETPRSFPEDRLLDLVLKGFRVGKRFNYRDALITLLLNGAGFRASEPFHLYLWDVREDPKDRGKALVLIHHPAWGAAPNDPQWTDSAGRRREGNRVEYLAERWGQVPRTWVMSKASAGWKGGMHETQFGGYYKQAYWFVPELGELFWLLWNQYAEQVLRIDPQKRMHPYAFMNMAQKHKGAFYKLGKFEDSHAAAVKRIGLVPAAEFGTNIHGHRHAYGQRLRKAGVPKEMIRRFMHHTHLGSQDVYTEAQRHECLGYLKSATFRLNEMTQELRSQIVSVSREQLLGAATGFKEQL